MIELFAVLLTGILHFVFEELLREKALFVFGAGTAWLVYLVVRLRRDRSLPREWGFSRTRLRAASRTVTIVGLAFAGLLAAVAAARSTLVWHWHMLPLLALYPIWGIVQQFLLQALLARNLDSVLRPRWLVVPIAAVLFGLVHLPDSTLALLTFGMALVFTPMYLRYRNLWPLGVWHGWLGVLAYYWILARDPWVEMFG